VWEQWGETPVVTSASPLRYTPAEHHDTASILIEFKRWPKSSLNHHYFQQHQSVAEEVAEDQKRAEVVPVFQKGKLGEPSIYKTNTVTDLQLETDPWQKCGTADKGLNE